MIINANTPQLDMYRFKTSWHDRGAMTVLMYHNIYAFAPLTSLHPLKTAFFSVIVMHATYINTLHPHCAVVLVLVKDNIER